MNNPPRFIPDVYHQVNSFFEMRGHNSRATFAQIIDYLESFGLKEAKGEVKEIKSDRYQWRLDGKDEVGNKFFKYII